tara:strand:- start:415 stop:2433 length:2019 start_codon:yes stop_codon:yes gene_type:complete
MSYRHPRFYKEDYTGFNKAATAAFQQSFSEAKGYFDKKIEERKAYEADLHAQADKMREEAAASGQVGAEFQKKLEENIQNFLKEGLKMEATGKKGGIGLFGQNLTEYKKDKLDLDKANANFNAEIAAANGITDRAFVAGLEIDEDYDHGSGSYLEYASVVKALKSNFKEGGNMDFKYKGEGSNEFGFGVTINNPRWRPGDPEEEKMITYSAQDIQRLIGENDPEARKQIDENINTAVNTLITTAKSDLEERFASGRASGKDGVLYKGETSVDNTVAQYMREMRQQDENNPDDPSIIDDIFNNKVKFNDKIRLEELEKVEGSANLIGLANNEDNAEKLAMLLDMPHNELSYSKKILNEMGVEDVDGALKTLEAAKNNMVERYLKNEVMGSGIASKYIDPKAPQPPKGSGGGSGSKPPKVDNYAFQQSSKTYESINTTQSVFDKIKEIDASVLEGDFEGGLLDYMIESDVDYQFDATGFKETMTGQTFKYGGTNVPVKDFDIDKDGNMIFTFEQGSATEDEVDADGKKTGRKIRVDFQKDSDTFNIYDPEDMRNFYKAISPEMGGSTEYSRDFASAKFDKNIVDNFFEGDALGKLKDEKYGKWLNWIDKRVTRDANNNITSNYGKNRLLFEIANNEAYRTEGDPNYSPQLAGYYAKNEEYFDKLLASGNYPGFQ